MENQHRKISGYRELSQEEVDLMNEIKAKGMELEQLLDKVRDHIQQQVVAAANDSESLEEDRLDAAQPHRWLAIARTHFQEGGMAATRAVAQPTFFF